MTVKELIAILQMYPEDCIVEILASYDDGFGTAGGKITQVSCENGVIWLENNED